MEDQILTIVVSAAAAFATTLAFNRLHDKVGHDGDDDGRDRRGDYCVEALQEPSTNAPAAFVEGVPALHGDAGDAGLHDRAVAGASDRGGDESAVAELGGGAGVGAGENAGGCGVGDDAENAEVLFVHED